MKSKPEGNGAKVVRLVTRREAQRKTEIEAEMPREPDIFDDLDKLRWRPEEAGAADPVTEGLPRDPIGEPPPVPATAKRHTRAVAKLKGRWAPVALDWLTDRRWDRYLPSVMRLYLWLVFVSVRGNKPVAFTPIVTDTIGIARQHRAACLAQLETDGLVTVDRSDPALPIVTVKPHPAGLWGS